MHWLATVNSELTVPHPARHWLAVALRFTARRLLALSTRLSPPVPLPASHPAARAALRRAQEFVEVGEPAPYIYGGSGCNIHEIARIAREADFRRGSHGLHR